MVDSLFAKFDIKYEYTDLSEENLSACIYKFGIKTNNDVDVKMAALYQEDFILSFTAIDIFEFSKKDYRKYLDLINDLNQRNPLGAFFIDKRDFTIQYRVFYPMEGRTKISKKQFGFLMHMVSYSVDLLLKETRSHER